jgi:2-phospho-L-lactate guanylyltransferase (CobY/MobA/RfbA family)
MEIDLRQGCLAAVLDAGRACGCRLEVCSPEPLPLPDGVRHVPQQGTGFGARLEQAVSGAFSRGRGPLLVVGTDVPGLTRRHLREALALLREGGRDRVVLGPSPDGGLYLLAAARPLPGLAGAAPWCQGNTLAELRRTLKAAGREVVLLEPLADLDRPADLERWLSGERGEAERWRRIAGLLRWALAEHCRPPEPPPSPRRRPEPPATFAGRSPPSSLGH